MADMKWLPGSEAMFVFAALIVVPALISRFLVGVTWIQVACAFLIWFFCLWMLLGGPSLTKGEAIGWTMIIGMFFSWVGVPVVALILRAANLPYRFF
jgi:hypothetical protein